eukprot:5780700-Pleurochrysis_carterae.AAC.3
MRPSASGVAPCCHMEGVVPTTFPSSVSMSQINLTGRGHHDRIESVRMHARRAFERAVDQSAAMFIKTTHLKAPLGPHAVRCRQVAMLELRQKGLARTSRERLHRRSRLPYSDRHRMATPANRTDVSS